MRQRSWNCLPLLFTLSSPWQADRYSWGCLYSPDLGQESNVRPSFWLLVLISYLCVFCPHVPVSNLEDLASGLLLPFTQTAQLTVKSIPEPAQWHRPSVLQVLGFFCFSLAKHPTTQRKAMLLVQSSGEFGLYSLDTTGLVTTRQAQEYGITSLPGRLEAEGKGRKDQVKIWPLRIALSYLLPPKRTHGVYL